MVIVSCRNYLTFISVAYNASSYCTLLISWKKTNLPCYHVDLRQLYCGNQSASTVVKCWFSSSVWILANAPTRVSYLIPREVSCITYMQLFVMLRFLNMLKPLILLNIIYLISAKPCKYPGHFETNICSLLNG